MHVFYIFKFMCLLHRNFVLFNLIRKLISKAYFRLKIKLCLTKREHFETHDKNVPRLYWISESATV